MTDKLSPERRSENMRRIKSKGMKPEMAVRKLVYGMGYRYRLHRKELPGKPDIVFIGKKKAIFVHGCFWHLHQAGDCKIARIPKSNKAYWQPKLKTNRKRDLEHQAKLAEMGWQSMVIWECELNNKAAVAKKLRKFLV